MQSLDYASQSNYCEVFDCTVYDSAAPYLLGRRWITNVGLQFVKYNQFDYANASPITIKSSYDGGVKYNYVDNLASGDIVLTRINHSNPDSGYIVLKFVYVIDDSDTTNANNDKYIFNVKK